MAGGQCEVLIAIQHSPFIIDNIESCLEIGQLFDGQVRWQHILIDSPWFGLFSEHKSRTGDGVNQRNCVHGKNVVLINHFADAGLQSVKVNIVGWHEPAVPELDREIVIKSVMTVDV